MQHVGHRKSDEIAQLHQEIERLDADWRFQQQRASTLAAKIERLQAALLVIADGDYNPIAVARKALSATEQQAPRKDCCRQYAMGMPFCSDCPATIDNRAEQKTSGPILRTPGEVARDECA